MFISILTSCLLGNAVPRVEKIVYSTCSIHPEENEQVVAAALRSSEATAGGFTLAPRSVVLPEWSRRGQPGILDDTGGCYGFSGSPVLVANFYYSQATEAVVRCSPGEDLTNGFFVSCFIRPSMREAEATVAERNNVTGLSSVTMSAKRRMHGEDSGVRTVLAPPSSQRRKKRKKKK